MSNGAVRLSEEAKELLGRILARMREETGVEVPQTQVVTLALRKLAESMALAPKQSGKAEDGPSVEKSTLR